MIVRKFPRAKSYEAPNHRDYKSLRVFGAEMGGSQALMFGVSHFLPGGGGRARRFAAGEDLLRAGGELTVIVWGRQGTGDPAGRQLRRLGRRKPRHRQPRPGGVHHRGCRDDAE